MIEDQLVVFGLGNECYGVDISAVETIVKMQTITAVPRAPLFVEGVINLRGKVLPVVDLRQRFYLSMTEKTKDSRIIVVDIEGTTVGMVVDAVSEVMRVTEDAIEPPSPIVMTASSACVRGIAKVGERLVILLNLRKLLTFSEIADLEELAVA